MILPTTKGAGWGNLLTNMFSKKPSTQIIEKTIARPLSSFTQDALSKIDLEGDDFFSQLSDIGVDEQAIRASGDSNLIALFDQVSQSEKGIIKTSEAYRQLGTTVVQVEQSVGGSITLFSKLGSVIKNIGSTFLNMAAMTAAMFVVGEVIKVIQDLIHAQDILIEKGKEARSTIEDISNKYNDTKKSISDVKDEYGKLSEGVIVDDGQVKNLKLSDDEFERYKQISQQLAELSPELVTGYDNQGNAIVNLGNSVESVNTKFEDFLNLQQRIANGEIGDNLDSVFKGIVEQVDKYTDEYEKAEGEYNNAKEKLEYGQNSWSSIEAIDNKGKSKQRVTRNTQYIAISEEEFDSMNSILTEMQGKGAHVQAWEPELETTPGIRHFTVDFSKAKLTHDDFSKINRIQNASVAGQKTSSLLSEASMKKYQMLIENEYGQIVPYIQDYIETTPLLENIGSDSLEEKLRNGMKTIFSNIDYSAVATDIEDIGGIENFTNDFIASMMSTEDTRGAFEGLVNLAETEGEKTYNQIESAKNRFYEIIKQAFTDENGDSIYSDDDLDILFGYSEQGKYFVQNKYRTKQNEMIEKLGFTGEYAKRFRDEFDKVDYKYAQSALQAVADIPQDEVDKISNNWESFWEYIEPYLTGKQIIKEEKTDVLSNLFNDESYKQKASEYESNLSALSSSLETLRQEGTLTAEQLVKLQESFPDLTEFTDKSLKMKAFDQLDSWITNIRESMDGMSDEGKKQTQEYIQNLIDSYGDLGLSVSDAANLFVKSRGHIGQEQASDRAEFNRKVEQLRSDLADRGKELDTHVLYTIVAQDQFSGDAEAIYNAYNNAELNWSITLEKEKLEKDIEQQQAIIDKQQSERANKEASGGIITSDDYDLELRASRNQKNDRARQAELARQAWVNFDVNSAADSERKNELWADYQNALKESLDADTSYINTQKESFEAEANDYQAAVTKADNAVTSAQNAIDEAEAKVGEGNAEQALYDALATAYAERATANVNLSSVWAKIANEHPEYFDEYMANSLSAQSSATSDTESAKQQQGMDLQQRYNDLQADATKLQRELTVAEQKHQKVSKQTYQDLIKNGQNQIKILRKQQEEADGNIDKIREYQDQIDSMNDSIYEWGNTMENLVVDQATSLTSALSTAFSESMSETGLTSDTINQLVTGFSDVLGKDFDQSDMFYATADGVKVNADALRELTEAEYELQAVDLQNEINATREAMENAPTNTIYDSAKEKLEQLMQTQSQFFVQYEEMQKALSDYNALQIAQSTENQGAVYDSLTSTYKSMKEAYDNGFTGTDEFKAFTKLADAYGRTTTEAYEAVAPKLERYLTEDPYAGTENFLQDLKSLGFAEQDAEGAWSWRIDDLNEAAQKMGIGVELFNSMFGKLEEYDFSNYVVESLTEAQLKTQQLEMDLEQAEQTYADMFKAGASSDDLEKQKEVIDDIRDSFENIEMAKDDYLNNQAQKQKNDFMNLDNTLKMYQDMYTEATSDEERENIHEMAEREVSQYGYSLKVDSIELTDEAQADFQDRMSNISVDFSKYQQGFIQAGQGKEFNQFKEYYENNTEAAQDYLSVLSKISKEDLSKVSLSNGEYEIDPEAENALQGLADAAGFTNENMEVLLTLIGLVNDELGEIEVPKGTSLESILSTTTKGSGAGYDIDLNPQYSQMSADQLNTQLSEIGQLKLEIASDSPAYQELQELEEGAQLELEIREKVSTGEYSLESIRDLLAQGATAEDIAINLGINADEEGLATVNRLIEMAQNSALVIQIDSSQFDQLVSAITGEPITQEVEFKPQTEEVDEAQRKIQEQQNRQTLQENRAEAAAPSGLAKSTPYPVQRPATIETQDTVKVKAEFDDAAAREDINNLVSQDSYMNINIGANISEAEGQINKVEQEAESSNPKITPQVVVQKAMSGIQNFVQKVQGSIQKVSSASPTAEMNVDNSNVEKGTSEATKDVKKFDKTSGTAKVTVDTSQAMAAIAGLRANLQALSDMRPSISVESGSINTAISRAQSLIAKLNEAAAKKVSVAAGTAYASGTIGKINSTIHKTSTPISHAYASGTQDWTVGEDEEALVNELGQESIVIFCDFIR